VEADADEAKKRYTRIIADDLLEALEYDPRNREFLLELMREASRICVKMWEGKYKGCYEMEAELIEASRRVWEKMRKARGDEAFLEFLGYTSALHSLPYAIWSEIHPLNMRAHVGLRERRPRRQPQPRGEGHPQNLLCRLCNTIADRGVVVAAAAGNSGERGIESPGMAANVITVGAVDKRGRVAPYSSRDILGLGKPDVVAPGGLLERESGTVDFEQGIISLRSKFSGLPPYPDEKHASLCGTSMATPTCRAQPLF